MNVPRVICLNVSAPKILPRNKREPPRTLWNSLPAFVFPPSYDLNSFKTHSHYFGYLYWLSFWDRHLSGLFLWILFPLGWCSWCIKKKKNFQCSSLAKAVRCSESSPPVFLILTAANSIQGPYPSMFWVSLTCVGWNPKLFVSSNKYTYFWFRTA